MSAPTKQPPRPWGIASWVTLAICILLSIPLTIAGFRFANETKQKQAVVDQMKRLLRGLKIFANDNGGYYPFLDPQWPTANAGFRFLAQEGILENETDLGAISSPFHPDGEMGTLTDRAKFAEPGECHWMVIKQSSTNNDGRDPLIFDNALKAEWPPRWRANSDGQPVRGRTLFGGSIVIGFNDNTVCFFKLEPSADSELVLPEMDLPFFHSLTEPPGIADVEEVR